jgi:integrase
MSNWIERWNDTIAAEPEMPGVWRRKDGGFHIRGRATDPNTGRLREINRALPECKRATKAAAELESGLDAIRQGSAQAAGAAVPRFSEYAVELFGRKVASGDIASAAGREKWSWVLTKHLVPKFGDWYLDKISKPEIERWKATLSADKYAPTTVNTVLSVLKAIYAAACDDYKGLENPAYKVKPCNLKAHRTYTDEAPNALPAEDVWRFLDETRVLHPSHYAMIYLGMVTGWRPSMLRPLRRRGPHADINWETGVVKARRSHTIGDETMAGTKTGRDEIVKLPPEAIDVLRWHVERMEAENEKRAKRSPENAAAMRASELLFPAEPNGRNRGGGYRSKSSLDVAFDDAGKAIGLTYKVTPRALRRSFQDLAREAGISDVLARGICGHRTPAMTARYSTVGLNEKEHAIGKLIDFTAAKRARSETPLAPPHERSDTHRTAPTPPTQAGETIDNAHG